MIDVAAIHAWNAANRRARWEYYAEPLEFHKPQYCPKCVHPTELGKCEHCRAVLRMRKIRKERRSC